MPAYTFAQRMAVEEPKYHVMIVDDEPAIRQVFTRFLERRGHQVTTCGTAGEALQVASERKFSVVITDLVLPDMTGLDLASELRQLAPEAKLILLTGEPSDATARRADELKIFKYLAKPIRAAALIDVVEEAGKNAG